MPALPPELEEAKRAGMMAANPVPESEDDDQEDIEVRLTDRVARLHDCHELNPRNVSYNGANVYDLEAWL